MIAPAAIAITLAEIFLITASGVLVLQAAGFHLRETVPVALTLTLGILSYLAQVSFLVHQPGVLPLFEAGVLVLALVLTKVHWGTGCLLRTIREHLRSERILWIVVTPPLLYLVAVAIAIPEGNYDSMRYNLARVLLFAQEKTFFLPNVSEWHQVVFPVGGDILRYYILRYHTDFGVSLFNVAALLIVALGNFALARNYASRGASMTAALIIASAPLLIYQSTGTKPDLLAAAVVSSALIVGQRLYRQGTLAELGLLIAVLAFGVSIKTTFAAVGIPLAVVAGFSLAFGANRSLLRLDAIRMHWRWGILVALLVAVLSQAWLFAYNAKRFGTWAGPPDFVEDHTHSDGLIGTGANLVRYGFQSIQVLSPTDVVAKGLLGYGPGDVLNHVYRSSVEPLLGTAGISPSRDDGRLDVAAKRSGDGENGAWFGPLGFLVVIPSVVLGMISGRGYLRFTALIVVASVFVIAWTVTWMPWNGRFFSICFAGCGPCVAFAIDRWVLFRRFHFLLRTAAVGILYYSCCFNTEKDLFNPRGIIDSIQARTFMPSAIADNIWHRTRWGQNRDYYNRLYFGDDRVQLVSEQLRPGAVVALIAGGNTWVFPFLQRRPDVRFIPALYGSPWPTPVDYVLCVDVACRPEQMRDPAKALLSAAASPSRKPGGLFDLANSPGEPGRAIVPPAER